MSFVFNHRSQYTLSEVYLFIIIYLFHWTTVNMIDFVLCFMVWLYQTLTAESMSSLFTWNKTQKQFIRLHWTSSQINTTEQSLFLGNRMLTMDYNKTRWSLSDTQVFPKSMASLQQRSWPECHKSDVLACLVHYNTDWLTKHSDIKLHW